MKVVPILILLLILLAGSATAANVSVLQPARTIQIATTTTTTTTFVPVVRATTATTTPEYASCAAPALCLTEAEAIAKWGDGNFAQDSELACGPAGRSATSRVAAVPYCYRPSISAVHTLTTIPAVPSSATTIPATDTITTTGTGTDAGSAVVTQKTIQAAATSLPETTVTTVSTSVTKTPAAAAAIQPASPSFIDSFIGFFASLFGGGKSGGSTPPSGGDMEPTPSLPGGMQPVTHTTPVQGKGTVDTTITVTSPAEGATYASFDVIPVKWVVPATPAGTVNLRLVSWSGYTETEWAHAIVPNTGSFDWHQQDLARDCGVGGNVECFGGLTQEEMGIVSPIQYADSYKLPAYNHVRVEVSTDPIDPYPAYSGRSGEFTIKNNHAFVPLTLNQARSLKSGSYPEQSSSNEETMPWTGYRNYQNGNDPMIHHERWRAVLVPDLSKYYLSDTFSKAILTFRVETDTGTGNGVDPSSVNRKDVSAVAHVWVLNDEYKGFGPESSYAVIASYDIPATAGSNSNASFDPATGTVTVDITVPFNQWFTKVTKRAIVLVGPDETMADTIGFSYSRIENVVLTAEQG